jgi:hypothetical protein
LSPWKLPPPQASLQRSPTQTGFPRFSAAEPGNYQITIAADGFAVWTAANIGVGLGDDQPLLSPVLEVASASSSINVTLPQHEVAAEQLKAEEKQRLLGLFPNFFVRYAPNAAPLTAAQKFQFGWKTISDPVVIADTGIGARIQLGETKIPNLARGWRATGSVSGPICRPRQQHHHWARGHAVHLSSGPALLL